MSPVVVSEDSVEVSLAGITIVPSSNGGTSELPVVVSEDSVEVSLLVVTTVIAANS